MDDIIKRILLLCDYLGLSISSFASAIGVNQVTLNNYKLGKRKPSLELIEKVTDKYPQVSAEWLIRGIGQMFCPTETKDINEMFDDKTKELPPPQQQPLSESTKDEIIVSQQATIASQQETIRVLQELILKSGLQSNK